MIGLEITAFALEVAQVSWLDRYIDETEFEITVDVVGADPLSNDFMTGPAQLPQRLLPHHFRQALFRADARNQLTAVAAGRAPANLVGFHDVHLVTHFSQVQCGGDTGKPGANDANIGVVLAA